MSKLIAMVATAVMAGGVRTVIQPGEELPELSPHDTSELLAMGAAQDPAAVAADQAVDAAVAAHAAAEFEAARAAVQAERASIEPAEPAALTPAPAPAPAVPPAPAAKAGKK